MQEIRTHFTSSAGVAMRLPITPEDHVLLVLATPATPALSRNSHFVRALFTEVLHQTLSCCEQSNAEYFLLAMHFQAKLKRMKGRGRIHSGGLEPPLLRAASRKFLMLRTSEVGSNGFRRRAACGSSSSLKL